ncbi:MAG: response regulator [Chloroflexi bacterium]|nr:response regulator [Chloroflexota bacterium]
MGVLRRDPEPVRTGHAASRFTVLALSPDADDHSSLAQLCSHAGWGFRSAYNVRQALNMSRSKPVAVVICERELPDGDWRGVFDELQRLPAAPLLIVVSRLADEALWAEVLNMGGYDVLLKPFDLKELMWSVTSAFRHWESHTQVRFAATPCPPAA